MRRYHLLIASAIVGLGLTTSIAKASVVEDFSGYSVGDNLVGVGGWDSATPGSIIAEVKDDPVAPGNNVGFFQRTGKATPSLYLDLGAHAISEGAIGKFSVRFLFDEKPNFVFGLSTLAQPGSTSPGYGAGTQLMVDFRINRGELIYMIDQGHSIGTTLATNLDKDTWYTLSATINNHANTVSDFYLNGTLVDSGTYSFNAFAAQDLGDLRTFFVYEQGFTAGVYLDDIAVETVPTPSAIAGGLVLLGGLALRRGRRRRSRM